MLGLCAQGTQGRHAGEGGSWRGCGGVGLGSWEMMLQGRNQYCQMHGTDPCPPSHPHCRGTQVQQGQEPREMGFQLHPCERHPREPCDVATVCHGGCVEGCWGVHQGCVESLVEGGNGMSHMHSPHLDPPPPLHSRDPGQESKVQGKSHGHIFRIWKQPWVVVAAKVSCKRQWGGRWQGCERMALVVNPRQTVEGYVELPWVETPKGHVSEALVIGTQGRWESPLWMSTSWGCWGALLTVQDCLG